MLMAGITSCRSPQTAWTENDGGATRWITVPAGRLKTRLYTGSAPTNAPVLALVLHGDLPEPSPSYQYEFAKVIADRFTNVVAAGVLRPGYRDPTGAQSSGDMGAAVADNYTPDVVDAVAQAARELADAEHASAIILVGHSGGAAIVANILGRHPGLARGAVLVGCGCDPSAWRARRRVETGNPIFEGPTRSLLPMDLAPAVAPGTLVRMVVGENDDVAPPANSQAYAAALRKRGIDVSVNVVAGLGHNILFTPRVLEAVEDVLMRLAEPERKVALSHARSPTRT
jgi:predicted esterase